MSKTGRIDLTIDSSRFSESSFFELTDLISFFFLQDTILKPYTSDWILDYKSSIFIRAVESWWTISARRCCQSSSASFFILMYLDLFLFHLYIKESTDCSLLEENISFQISRHLSSTTELGLWMTKSGKGAIGIDISIFLHLILLENYGFEFF